MGASGFILFLLGMKMASFGIFDGFLGNGVCEVRHGGMGG
jgi:hypothetical protein